MLRIFSSVLATADAGAAAEAEAAVAAGFDATGVTGSSFFPQAVKAKASNTVIQKFFFMVLMPNAGNKGGDCMKILPQIQSMKTGSPVC